MSDLTSPAFMTPLVASHAMSHLQDGDINVQDALIIFDRQF